MKNGGNNITSNLQGIKDGFKQIKLNNIVVLVTKWM